MENTHANISKDFSSTEKSSKTTSSLHTTAPSGAFACSLFIRLSSLRLALIFPYSADTIPSCVPILSPGFSPYTAPYVPVFFRICLTVLSVILFPLFLHLRQLPVCLSPRSLPILVRSMIFPVLFLQEFPVFLPVIFEVIRIPSKPVVSVSLFSPIIRKHTVVMHEKTVSNLKTTHIMA